MKSSIRLLLAALLPALAGCATTFDSEATAIAAMERQAYAHREFDRPNVPMTYRFVEDPAQSCVDAGTPPGYGASSRYTIRGCALIASDPCLIILSFYPTKAEIKHEESHCKWGSWHKGEAVSATGERVGQ